MHARVSYCPSHARCVYLPQHTFPTAASPSSTSLTLLVGFAAGAPAASAMVFDVLYRD